MDGSDDVEGVLENLAGAGVNHRPLEKHPVSQLVQGNILMLTHESGGIAGNPGDEDDLGAAG